MASFGVIVEEKPLLESFIKEVNERLSSYDLVKSPFKGVVERWAPGVYACYFKPLLFPAYWIGIFPFSLGVFFSSTWLFVVAAFFFASGFFWSPFFYALLFFFGLRKKGYKGRIRFVSLGKAFGVARCGTE